MGQVVGFDPGDSPPPFVIVKGVEKVVAVVVIECNGDIGSISVCVGSTMVWWHASATIRVSAVLQEVEDEEESKTKPLLGSSTFTQNLL